MTQSYGFNANIIVVNNDNGQVEIVHPSQIDVNVHNYSVVNFDPIKKTTLVPITSISKVEGVDSFEMSSDKFKPSVFISADNSLITVNILKGLQYSTSNVEFIKRSLKMSVIKYSNTPNVFESYEPIDDFQFNDLDVGYFIGYWFMSKIIKSDNVDQSANIIIKTKSYEQNEAVLNAFDLIDQRLTGNSESTHYIFTKNETNYIISINAIDDSFLSYFKSGNLKVMPFWVLSHDKFMDGLLYAFLEKSELYTTTDKKGNTVYYIRQQLDKAVAEQLAYLFRFMFNITLIVKSERSSYIDRKNNLVPTTKWYISTRINDRVMSKLNSAVDNGIAIELLDEINTLIELEKDNPDVNVVFNPTIYEYAGYELVMDRRLKFEPRQDVTLYKLDGIKNCVSESGIIIKTS